MHGTSHPVLKTPISRGRRAQKSRRNPILRHIPCGPGARPRCGNSPPPGSGSEWRRASGSGSSLPAPSAPRSLWLFRQTWPCLCLGTQRDSVGTGERKRHSQVNPRFTCYWRDRHSKDKCSNAFVVFVFPPPRCAQDTQTAVRARAISRKWPDYWPHDNHPPLQCRKKMFLLSWGLLQVIMQRKSRKPQLEIG